MKSDEISKLLIERIEAQDFPSAVYLVAEKGRIVLHDAVGLAVVEPEKIEARSDTIYDLASLTKPLVTGLLCAKLIEESKLKPLVMEHLPEFDYARSHPKTGRAIGTWELLYHCSGFPAWKPFYLTCRDRDEILREILKTTERPSAVLKVEYSDLNYLILTFLLERIYDQRIDEIAKNEIFEPLGLKRTGYNPPENLKREIAASELGNFYEKQMCHGFHFDTSRHDWREYQIWGEVHDGNCYFMDGVSGHAGLFSTAEEVCKIALQFLPQTTELLKPETCALFRTNFTKGLNEARSLAFQLAETKDSSAGASLSADSFGHLGFTGTSLWIEPETERIFILLTNRTHHRKPPFVLLNSTRRKFHEIATEILDRKIFKK